jgi:YebC/PmpR family DNA-binding regulatory protein
MSGHSKWSTIKRQKGVTDAKRGAAFTKAANAITVAARSGGESPETNFKLRLAVEAARAINMPKENVSRAIARGVGKGSEAAKLEQLTYEGFGPGGVAILVESVTDNKSRTAQEVRSVFERNGGRLGGSGAVSHLFKSVGEIVVKIDGTTDPDQILLVAAEADADDVEVSENEAQIFCEPSVLEKVKTGVANGGLDVVESKLSRKPASSIEIRDEKKAEQILLLVNKLEDLQDVQTVYANFDIPDDILQKAGVN